MEFHAGWKLHRNGLKRICLKSDLFRSLGIAVNIGFYLRIGKGHRHVRDLRLAHTVVIEFHGQRLSGGDGAGKGITASICISGCQMGNDKTLSGREIRMLFCEKSFIPAGFCTVIADFR